MRVTDIVCCYQLQALRDAGYVVIHREPTESMIKAMLSARDSDHVPVAIDIEKAFHRAIGESIQSQNRFDPSQTRTCNGSKPI